MEKQEDVLQMSSQTILTEIADVEYLVESSDAQHVDDADLPPRMQNYFSNEESVNDIDIKMQQS